MKIHLFLFLFLLCVVPLSAQIHLGTNQTYPNIQAAANVIQPGDTVYLHAGTYAGYQAVTDLEGTAAQWIVFTTFQNDSIAISGGWQFVRCKYLQFSNLNFKANAAHPGRLFSIDNGGSCATQSKHILVENCNFANTTDAAASVAFKFAGVDSFVVRNCVFENIIACEAMSYNTCHFGSIINNRFENCLSGGHIKGGSSSITLERNRFINAAQAPWATYELGGDTGAPFYCPSDSFEVKDLRFYANIIQGGYRGLALSSAKDCRVVNNTFYNCGQATMRFLTTSNLFPELSGNQVENNLFAFGSSAYFNGGPQPSGTVNFSHNLYYSIQNDPFNGPYWDSPALDGIKDQNPLNYGSNTPMFVDGPGDDFNLIAGSPAIGAGKAQMEPITDFYGKPFSSAGRSIGAIESTETTKTQILENPIRIYPNPATHALVVVMEGYNGCFEIWNALGEKQLESKAQQEILISHLSPGVYILKAGRFSARFIKI